MASDIDVNDPDVSSLPFSKLIGSLASFRNEHEELIAKCVTADGNPDGPVGHVIVAALHRSRSLLNGFVKLLTAENKFAAMPLIRLQLDSAMRVHSCSLVKDRAKYIDSILRGMRPSDYGKAEGVTLSDASLHGALTKKYAFASDVYGETNSYIHLSNLHLYGIFDFAQLKAGILQPMDHEGIPPFPEQERKGSLLTMIFATHILVEECKALEASR
jgi:hypothetical protein